MRTVTTVLGPIRADEMGITLSHEHVFTDVRSVWHEPQEATKKKIAYEPVKTEHLGILRLDPLTSLDNCTLFDQDAAVQELMHFKAHGGRTVVDHTCRGIGRDPLALQRVSRLTGLNIVMGTGYYLDPSLPRDFAERSVESIRDEIVRDIVEGVPGTGVRAGFIGEIGTSAPIASNEEKSLRAAAQAQAATGVALSVHLDGWAREGHRVLDIVSQEGGDLSKVILCHMNPSYRDEAYQRELADRGAYIEYDMVGMDYSYGPDKQSPLDTDTAAAILELARDGYLERILISQDVFIKMMLKRYGGFGYSHILENYVPLLLRMGATQEQIRTLLVSNPARVFSVESE